MKKYWLTKLDYLFYYYVGYFLTNGHKMEQYTEMMIKKWDYLQTLKKK